MYAVIEEPPSYLPPTHRAIADAACMAPPLMQLYLDRSGTLPLDITLGAKTPTDILKQFVGRAPQIRLLSFEMVPWSRWKVISAHFSVSTLPTLLHLRIPVDTRDENTVPDSALFPHAFNLRHLSILVSGRSVPILSYIAFPNLAAIHISFRGSYVGRRRVAPVRPIATLGQLLDIFRSLPLLEDVYLTFRVLTTEPGVSHQIVPLPRLRKFITSCNPTPTPLLTSIDSPLRGFWHGRLMRETIQPTIRYSHSPTTHPI